MKVSLRKASNLSKELISSGRRADATPHSIQVTAFSPRPIVEVVSEAGDRLVERAKRALRQIDAGYEIRKLIGEANSQKISSVLTRKKSIDECISALTSMISGITESTPDDVQATSSELSAAAAGTERFRSTTSHVGYPSESLDEVRSLISELKLSRRRLDDDLALLNSEGSVVIPDRIVTILVEEKLV